MSKKVLIACEFSGIVRKAFEEKGFDSWSCDIFPTEDNPQKHIQDDIMKHLKDGWDLMIAHPPCTFLTITGNKWMNHPRFPNRAEDRAKAIQFVIDLWNAPIKYIAIENPVGVLSTQWMKPTQIIQPYNFGHKTSKKTCLWLKNLPVLQPTEIVEPEWYYYKNGRRDSIWHIESMKMKPLERMKYRSRTFIGIANAMSTQWSEVLK